MSAKILNFEIPEIKKVYVEPEGVLENLEIYDFDVKKTLGPIGEMIQDHKHLVLSWLEHGEFLKPASDWSGIAKEAIISQRLSFNSRLDSIIKDVPVTLLGGEDAILKKASFVVRDITDERQEVARIVGIVSEVLFLEGVVYLPSSMSYCKVEDYQIKKAMFSGSEVDE